VGRIASGSKRCTTEKGWGHSFTLENGEGKLEKMSLGGPEASSRKKNSKRREGASFPTLESKEEPPRCIGGKERRLLRKGR